MRISNKILLTLLLSFCLLSEANAQKYEASWESLADWNPPQWFEDAVLGFYVHWGPYSVPGFPFKLPSERVDSGIWYGGGMYYKYTDDPNPEDVLGVYEFHIENYGDPEDFGYHDLIELFKAENWDPDEWARLYREAGADYGGVSAEHGDGYPMWDTKYNKFNSMTTGPKRDIVGELFEALNKQGLKTVATIHEHPGSLFGHAQEFAPPESHIKDPEYADLYNADSDEVYINKVYELIGKYKPDQLWLDNPILSSEEDRWLKFVSDYYNFGEEWGTGGVFISQKATEEIILQHTVLDIEGGEFPAGIWRWAGMTEPQERRWQKDVPIGNYWAYAEGVGCRPVNMLVDGIVDRISKNGVTLLNLAPKSDGTFPQEQLDGLKELGEWMAINKEALYPAKPAHFIEGGADYWQTGTMRLLEKGDFLYVVELGNIWPTKKGFADYEDSTPPSSPVVIPDVTPAEGAVIKMLGSDKELSWRMDRNDLVIEELPDPLPCEHAWTFKVKIH